MYVTELNEATFIGASLGNVAACASWRAHSVQGRAHDKTCGFCLPFLECFQFRCPAQVAGGIQSIFILSLVSQGDMRLCRASRRKMMALDTLRLRGIFGAGHSNAETHPLRARIGRIGPVVPNSLCPSKAEAGSGCRGVCSWRNARRFTWQVVFLRQPWEVATLGGDRGQDSQRPGTSRRSEIGP